MFKDSLVRTTILAPTLFLIPYTKRFYLKDIGANLLTKFFKFLAILVEESFSNRFLSTSFFFQMNAPYTALKKANLLQSIAHFFTRFLPVQIRLACSKSVSLFALSKSYLYNNNSLCFRFF
jgi:hypothetical protein